MAGTSEKHVYCLYPDSLPDWGVTSIVLAEDEEGIVWFPVRSMCRGLGIDAPTQTGMIREDAGLSAQARDIKIPTPGGRQDMLCLTKKGVAMWLARIDSNRVAKHARGRLKEYQDDLWALAQRLVFSRKRTADATIEDVGDILTFAGKLRGEIICDCGRRHIIEIADGQWRVYHVEPIA